MKINWNYIKVIGLLAVVAFLFSFAKNRNNERTIEAIHIEFTDGENFYITKSAVNKLLIQKIGNPKKLAKDTLDLSSLEKVLDQQEMIADADVYLSLNGVLGVSITQRKPIARVLAENPFYLDTDGKKMPLSSHHSARVPILVGIESDQMEEVFPLLDKIANDPFLKHLVVGVQRATDGTYNLTMREMPFDAFLGLPKNLGAKLKNFKAFYKKASKENKLNTYKKVDLQFENQVVCTKI